MKINGKEYKFRKATMKVLSEVGKLERKFGEADGLVGLFQNISANDDGLDKLVAFWSEYAKIIFDGDFPNVEELTMQEVAKIQQDFLSPLEEPTKKP